VALAFVRAVSFTPTITIASTQNDLWSVGKEFAIGADEHLYIWRAVAVGGANTVTLTEAPPGGQQGLMISEWSGGNGTCAVDQSASANAGSGAQSSGSMTPGTSNQLVIGFGIATGAVGSATLTALDFQPGGVYDMRSEYQIQTTAATVAVSFTGGSGQWGALGVTIK
jgi:hypothetical protein